jgi:TRAP-type C4-dicarboxylate transport system permease large subunit
MRHIGIAIGCFVAAWLVIGLIGGFLVPFGSANVNWLLAFILGGLIYRDIIRRERREP